MMFSVLAQNESEIEGLTGGARGSASRRGESPGPLPSEQVC